MLVAFRRSGVRRLELESSLVLSINRETNAFLEVVLSGV